MSIVFLGIKIKCLYQIANILEHNTWYSIQLMHIKKSYSMFN